MEHLQSEHVTVSCPVKLISMAFAAIFSALVELRQRQELIMRNQMAMAPQILAQGQQRLQGVPAQFEPRFMERSVSEFN